MEGNQTVGSQAMTTAMVRRDSAISAVGMVWQEVLDMLQSDMTYFDPKFLAGCGAVFYLGCAIQRIIGLRQKEVEI